jgi:hypothetical protein
MANSSLSAAYRQSGAINLDKRLITAKTVIMNGMHTGLCRAAFAANQHRRIAVGHLVNQPVNL